METKEVQITEINKRNHQRQEISSPKGVCNHSEPINFGYWTLDS